MAENNNSGHSAKGGLAAAIAIIAAGLIINVISGGIRNNVGIIINPITEQTGIPYADVSFALIGEALREAFKERDFILVSLAFFTCGFHMVFINTHFVVQMVSGGISETKAASIYMLFGIGAMIGSVLSGALCQKLQIKNVLSLAYGLRVFLVLAMIVLPISVPVMVLISFFFGFTGDASVAPTQQIVSNKFGARKSAMLFGIAFVSHQIGGFISSWIGGVLIQNGGNYTVMWIVDMALCGVAAVLAYFASKDK